MFKPRLKPEKMPKHVALTASGHLGWASKNEVDIQTTFKYVFAKLNEIIELQLKYEIPLTTVYLLTSKVSDSEYFTEIIDSLVEQFNVLAHNELVHDNKIKISILGKWYNLPNRVVDPIKKIIDETKDYDHFFLNLCINYDGKEEIVDSCKMISRKILADKIDIDAINEEAIKDNLYSSYFLPPDLIIKTGRSKQLGTFLLWDSPNAIIDFTDIFWIDFTEKDFVESIKYYQNNSR
ncbi:di-trans,poly-cis-decaprenylcistransferase [Candidatus Woesearchaeota archaeon]|mgnify:CR=1 FL=1|jgi:undecaprenyl diphosphate synthase|nr:di-trans,poly-cis-decaprenylcistransferase [Candidatus Woesearchaeota archaeon]